MTQPETNPSVFTLDRIWQAYQAAMTATSNKEVAIIMGISEERLKAWMGENPALYRAITAARANSSGASGTASALTNHITNSLPPELRELWDELSGENMTAQETVRYNLATRGDYDKQRLLVHALSVTRFDLNKCCQILDISKAKLDSWVQNDPRFAQLWEQVHWAKQNFLESALMEKVADGDTKSIIFANSTLNRDRGYGQTVKVEATHTHVHAVVDVTKLNLPTEIRSAILTAIRDSGAIDLDGLLIEDPLRRNVVDAIEVLPQASGLLPSPEG
jgi:hypothetical protein